MPERLEFVTRDGGDAGDADLLTLDGPGGGPPRSGRTGWRRRALPVLVLVGVVVAVVGVRLAARPDDPPTPTASPATDGPVVGRVDLPAAFGAPTLMVGAPRTDDGVWLADGEGAVVAVVDGRVVADRLLPAPVSAMAAGVDGGRLYVATAGDPARVLELDARTLEQRAALYFPYRVADIAASTDAVWVAGGTEITRLDLGTLARGAPVALTGAAALTHLRASFDGGTGHEVLVGLQYQDRAPPNFPLEQASARLVRVDTVTAAVTAGPTVGPGVTAATGTAATDADDGAATWLVWTAASATAASAEAFGTSLTAPDVVAPALFAGAAAYDGGGGSAAFLVVQSDGRTVACRDPSGFAIAQIAVGTVVSGAHVTGPVVRTTAALYLVADVGLVRTGGGGCR